MILRVSAGFPSINSAVIFLYSIDQLVSNGEVSWFLQRAARQGSKNHKARNMKQNECEAWSVSWCTLTGEACLVEAMALADMDLGILAFILQIKWKYRNWHHSCKYWTHLYYLWQ
jgi:hypothetical protein